MKKNLLCLCLIRQVKKSKKNYEGSSKVTQFWMFNQCVKRKGTMIRLIQTSWWLCPSMLKVPRCPQNPSQFHRNLIIVLNFNVSFVESNLWIPSNAECIDIKFIQIKFIVAKFAGLHLRRSAFWKTIWKHTMSPRLVVHFVKGWGQLQFNSQFYLREAFKREKEPLSCRGVWSRSCQIKITVFKVKLGLSFGRLP